VTAYCCASRNYLSGAGGGPDGKLEVIAYRPAPTIADGRFPKPRPPGSLSRAAFGMNCRSSGSAHHLMD